MPWTNISFNKDEDKNDVGSLTATWNQGLVDEFSFSMRVDSKKDIAVFVSKAKVAQAAQAAAKVKELTIAPAILTALNS